MRELCLILLAAGDSRRFGGNKLLYPFQDKPMYLHVVEEIGKLPEGIFSRKIIVSQYREILIQMQHRKYTVIENQDSCLGISHSIRLALTQLKGVETDYFFAVCDQPYLRADTMEGLVASWRKSGKGLGCLADQDVLGNPVIFSHPYQNELLELNGDEGGKKIIRRHLADLYCHQASDGKELVDIDERLEL